MEGLKLYDLYLVSLSSLGWVLRKALSPTIL